MSLSFLNPFARKRGRSMAVVDLVQLETELNELNKSVHRHKSKMLIVRRKKSYAQQSVILLGVLMTLLAIVALLVVDGIQRVADSMGIRTSNRIAGSDIPIDALSNDAVAMESVFLSLMSSRSTRVFAVFTFLFVFISTLYWMCTIWYNRQLTICEAAIEDAEARKNGALDMLKDQSKYFETIRLLQQYDSTFHDPAVAEPGLSGAAPAGVPGGSLRATAMNMQPGLYPQQRMSRDSAGISAQNIPAEAGNPLARGNSRNSANGSMNPRAADTQSMNYWDPYQHHANSEMDPEYMANYYPPPGSVLLNKFVDLLAGGTYDENASTSNTRALSQLQEQLENEKRSRLQLEAQLETLQAQIRKASPDSSAQSPRQPMDASGIDPSKSEATAS